MKILVQHIENLLPEHDCVVVPGLGGFVQNEVRAGVDAETGIFRPATKEICFNPRLKFNDGLLAQSYQELFGLSFEEANQNIQTAVQELLHKLDEGKFIRIGRIGTLTLSEGQMIFRPDHKNHFLPESYGLTPFAFDKLTTQSSTGQLSKKQQSLLNQAVRKQQPERNPFAEVKGHERVSATIELENALLLAKALRAQGFGVPAVRYNRIRPRQRRAVQYLVGVAVCLFFLFLSKPVGNYSGNNQEANLMIHQYLGVKTETQIVSSTSVAYDTTTSIESESSPKKQPIGAVLGATAKAMVQTSGRFRNNYEVQRPETSFLKIIQETLSIRKRTKMPSDLNTEYYVVVSTFSEKSTADTWLSMRNTQPALQGASIVNLNGWYRIVTRSFRSKYEARQFLKDYVETYPEYSSAWIFNQGN